MVIQSDRRIANHKMFLKIIFLHWKRYVESKSANLILWDILSNIRQNSPTARQHSAWHLIGQLMISNPNFYSHIRILSNIYKWTSIWLYFYSSAAWLPLKNVTTTMESKSIGSSSSLFRGQYLKAISTSTITLLTISLISKEKQTVSSIRSTIPSPN